MLKLHRRTQRARMRGMSLVELMVGIAVGLFVVAAAAVLVSSQLSDNRKLLAETQLQQDLRATADIITRELRRTGAWVAPQDGVPSPVVTGSVNISVSANPSSLLVLVPGSGTDTVFYNYRRTAGTEAFAFKLGTDGVLRSCQSDATSSDRRCSGAYQDLTDVNTVNILSFTIASVRADSRARPNNDNPITMPCPNLCADGTTACWPKVGVREVVFTIRGQSRSDDRVTRTLSSSVRIRNDFVQLSTEAPAGQSCPAS